MDPILLIGIFAVIVVGGFAALFLFLNKKFQKLNEPKENRDFLFLQNQVNDVARAVDNKLAESMRFLQHQSHESARMIKEITQELTRVNEGQKQVVGFADQLKNLQDILKNPKQRGVLGEYYLETLLKNVLPPGSYQMQYAFADGTIVDAVVFVKDKVIPIDSKFSLENYNRLIEAKDVSERERLEKVFVNDLKLRIQETSKYVQPESGTMEFAFMFVPHEAIYYDLLINKVGAMKDENENLIQRAAGTYKVIIVSPTSFLAYLQTVLQGLKAMQIEESAKEIRKRVGELGRHLSSYEMFMKKIGNHLGTTVNAYNSAYKELGKIDKDVMRISGSAAGIETEMIEKPTGDDL
ncbi:MAG: DNA recombination protein RmuC [Candidatus Harrisonbacteria bacterium CG10_big_fil_rev_8_21_14_0_10_40_38]|uniref:DNA recombination protein RmuC n=1 Tax=Candidatus Harrisonbacteria bacterium CG10_big_fil_rev_8_21_14_0_10_40_38 TaxID=1974583 RepID=A0A2H0UT09_9BACT|nr:MAG: DNA recombination protein RmuC [Candidatus Harrisonbacteria bacterium CG10_big_fil_rev_8_21_14_0_10_40_38]